jgi:trehalose 6-phosphate synthase
LFQSRLHLAQAPAAGGSTSQQQLAQVLRKRPLVVVANREPYVHEHGQDGVTVRRPPGGLVTALEPLLRACGGTWIAHGSGSADLETAGGDGVVAVPPDDPRYRLRRIFLTPEEVERYYCGFANEALWPLCHNAYAQPQFRDADWTAYRSVNRRFARAAAAHAANGLIFVQDYHLALVPGELRSLAPGATVAAFWHIPWPNAEVAAICPWMRDIVAGLLGADILGFHTEVHCRNFIETARELLPGCSVNAAGTSITFRGHRTVVRPYPISIEWPYPIATAADGAALRRELGLGDDVHVSVSVDRCDYTKGLLERTAAVELLLEQQPQLRGRYSLAQVVAPSRMQIDRYRDLGDDLEKATSRVNERFGTDSWQPLLLRLSPAPADEVRRYYAMADSALVTPLHDGMNLVAKEYAASCRDDRGVLVLSRFAGAAAEMEGALLVNPHHPQDVANAIARAIHMPPDERRARIRTMRAAVQRNTIDHWASRLLGDLAAVTRPTTLAVERPYQVQTAHA